MKTDPNIERSTEQPDQSVLQLYATKVLLGKKRYYLIWPSHSAEAATELVANYVSIGLATQIDAGSPSEIRLQVCYGAESDANWMTANGDAKRWELQGWIDLEPIVRRVLDRLAQPIGSLRQRAVILSVSYREQMGPQPIEQSPTITLAGLELAETVLTEMIACQTTDLRCDELETLANAVSEVIEAAIPILARLES